METIKQKGWPWNSTRLVLDQQTSFDTGKRGVYFKSTDGLFEVVDGVAFFHTGITWDGTTMVPDGVEDPTKPGFPITWKASLVHDIFCKYNRESLEFRKMFSRFNADYYFYKLLKQRKYKLALIYYIGVSIFTLITFCERM